MHDDTYMLTIDLGWISLAKSLSAEAPCLVHTCLIDDLLLFKHATSKPQNQTISSTINSCSLTLFMCVPQCCLYRPLCIVVFCLVFFIFFLSCFRAPLGSFVARLYLCFVRLLLNKTARRVWEKKNGCSLSFLIHVLRFVQPDRYRHSYKANCAIRDQILWTRTWIWPVGRFP